MTNRPLVSIVVPCFNEEAVVAATYGRIANVLEAAECDAEFVFVDDGSSDRTADVLLAVRREDPRVRLVRFSRNFGHQLAVVAGLEHASGDAVAVMDADLQDPPEVLLELLARWRAGFHVAYGVRRNRKEGLLKRAAYTLFYRVLARLSDFPVPLDAGDFSLMDRRVVDLVVASREHQPFVRGLRAWAGFRQVAVPFDRAARAAGDVKYSFTKLAALALSGLLGTSTFPLRLPALLGAVCATAGVAAAAVLASVGLSAAAVPAWFWPACIASGGLLLAGGQFLCLGLLGEYVARIHHDAAGRPRYVVAERHGFAPGPPRGSLPGAPSDRNTFPREVRIPALVSTAEDLN